MSLDAFRKNVADRLEKLNSEAMTHACGVRPHLETSADGLSLVVIDHLAMARAYATATAILNEEFARLTMPQQEEPAQRKIREVY